MSSEDAKVILEAFDDKFTLLLENMQGIIDRNLEPIQEDIAELQSDIKAIKAAVTDTNRDLDLLKVRVSQFEAHAA